MSWQDILKNDPYGNIANERFTLFPNGKRLPILNRWLKLPEADNTKALAQVVGTGYFIDNYTNTTYHVENREIVSINQE